MPSVPLTSIAGSGVRAWVSGATYAVCDRAISLVNFQVYVRRVGGGGTTDPANDDTNWRQTTTAIKQIILGSISIISPATSGTATISSVNTAKTRIEFLGVYSSNGSAGGGAVTLTNSTTVTAYNGASTGTSVIRYQIVEYY